MKYFGIDTPADSLRQLSAHLQPIHDGGYEHETLVRYKTESAKLIVDSIENHQEYVTT